MTKLTTFIQPQLKKDLPDMRPGDVIRVYQKIPAAIAKSGAKKTKNKSAGKADEGEKIQIFEGLILAKKHGKGISGTITVRKVIKGIGVEKIFPIHSPNIQKIEIVKRGKVRRAKLYYLRKIKGKKARLKTKEFVEAVAEEKPPEVEKTEKIEESKKESEK